MLATAPMRTLVRRGFLGPAPLAPMAADLWRGSIPSQHVTTFLFSHRRNLSREAQQAPNKVKLIWAGLDFTAGLPATQTLRPDWTYLAVSSGPEQERRIPAKKV